jgi:hypothetical protein
VIGKNWYEIEKDRALNPVEFDFIAVFRMRWIEG